MAWIDRPSEFYPIFKPDRPVIDIPQAAHHGHRDPLRTPEDIPSRVPWISTHRDACDVYHITPFDDDHNRFPDVEDVGWAMGMVSPPSPSRRNSLELLPDVSQYTDERGRSMASTASPASPSRHNDLNLPPEDDTDFLDDPPELSPPSPSVHSPPGLPEPESDWPPPDLECPQLSPPSPIHRTTELPSLDFDAHSLFVDDTPSPFVDPPEFSRAPSVSSRLHMEYRALLSLRERTMNAERTSRARNKALRGRERELGRAVAALRATTTTSDTALDVQNTLHTYRAAATHVMVERTEEKRRRKKDKERLKELRVLLGTGVNALLSTEGPQFSHVTAGMGMDPAQTGFDTVPFGLGLALHEPISTGDREHALLERALIMRRLAACMTMRRRDLGMRSLIEAGNMAEGGDEICSRTSRRPSGLAGPVLLADPDSVFASVIGDTRPGVDVCLENGVGM